MVSDRAQYSYISTSLIRTMKNLFNRNKWDSMKKMMCTGVMVLIALLSISFVSAEDTRSDTGGEFIWNGTWEGTNFTIFIQQDATGITGEYEPADGAMLDPGRLEGTISDDGITYSGVWIESGSVVQTLSDDNMSFVINGTIDPFGTMTEQVLHSAIATRVGEIEDPENPWTGNWTTGRKIYSFLQDGTSISGTNHPLEGVNDESGSLNGTVSEDGREYSGNWTETGIFIFTISEDGSSMDAIIHESLDPESNADRVTFTKTL